MKRIWLRDIEVELPDEIADAVEAAINAAELVALEEYQKRLEEGLRAKAQRADDENKCAQCGGQMGNQRYSAGYLPDIQDKPLIVCSLECARAIHRTLGIYRG
jgi:hypothetical protein